jgi:branched-chain amino acid transport system ATP-binding protein
MLELKRLTGGWGPTTIVEDVTLTVEPGQTVAILGRNGVGKSTLLELVANRARLHSGTIALEGGDVSSLPTHRRARLGLGYVPQQREVFKSLTVAEHIAIAERPGKWTRAMALSLFPSLVERLDSKAGTLSGGEQQMLAVARALIGNPTVLMLDEPSEGLAPVVVERLVEAIGTIVDERSMAILLVEQRIDVALALADRFIIMDRGRIVENGLTTDIRERQHDLPAMMGLGT